MAQNELLKPTLHVEVLVKGDNVSKKVLHELQREVALRLTENYDSVAVGQKVDGFENILHDDYLGGVEIAGYTGQENSTGFYHLQNVDLDVQAYLLKGGELRRSINQTNGDDTNHARILALPNTTLHEEWNSLVFDDGLPARLLRYLVRMTGMMRQPGLNLSTFNWNRLCLLHGPPGSGKSTLCRALAQKISIRLGSTFSKSTLVEINTNAMLSKYFGESGKLVGTTFDRITTMAEERDSLVCVVMEEIETIAGSRENVTSGNECRDGLRATNQLLTALDRLRDLSNVVVLCTSNLIEAIDPAFLDRVDIKQLIPSPSPAAIYNIFRSCLNELVRSSLIDAAITRASSFPASTQQPSPSSPQKPVTRSSKAKKTTTTTRNRSVSPDPWTRVSAPSIPTFSEMKIRFASRPASPGARVWALAQKCEGFSGRTLRRLPILGLAMYTGVGSCTLHDAVSALEAAVDQELKALTGRKMDVDPAS